MSSQFKFSILAIQSAMDILSFSGEYQPTLIFYSKFKYLKSENTFETAVCKI